MRTPCERAQPRYGGGAAGSQTQLLQLRRGDRDGAQRLVVYLRVTEQMQRVQRGHAGHGGRQVQAERGGGRKPERAQPRRVIQRRRRDDGSGGGSGCGSGSGRRGRGFTVRGGDAVLGVDGRNAVLTQRNGERRHLTTAARGVQREVEREQREAADGLRGQRVMLRATHGEREQETISVCRNGGMERFSRNMREHDVEQIGTQLNEWRLGCRALCQGRPHAGLRGAACAWAG